MSIENESNQMVLFLNLSDLLLRNQGRKDWEKSVIHNHWWRIPRKVKD